MLSVIDAMPASSNFRQTIQEAQYSSLVGPNVVRKALPVVGGGMVLTAVGVMGGLSMMGSPIFPVLFIGSAVVNFILFLVCQNIALKGNNGSALPLLATYSLVTGFTLSGLVSVAIGSIGIGAIATAALATGITFVIASMVGSRMSDSIGQALTAVVGLGMLGLILAIVIQLVASIFIPGFGGSSLQLLIAGGGTVVFVGAAFIDFYTMPRSYRDEQYLAGALGMYLTYINLFSFILRLMIALNGGGGRRD
jgi:FtsH-binding integral membrane protein